MKTIDAFLNRIPMYRLVLYCLTLIAICALAFSFLGIIAYNGLSLIALLGTLVSAAWISNEVWRRVLRIPANSESVYITAFILFFILQPVTSGSDILVSGTAALLAISSKYIFAIRRQHLFNPAALGAFAIGILGFGNAIWWIATPALLPAVFVTGCLIARKTRRGNLVVAFCAAAIALGIMYGLRDGTDIPLLIRQYALSWPLMFFAFYMLTEPSTMPNRNYLRLLFAGIVGILFSARFHFGTISATPEFALLIGNVLAYLASMRQKVWLQLVERREIAPHCFEYVFSPSEPLRFVAGQYGELTLPQSASDARGNRRTFTIASSPHDTQVRISTRIPAHERQSSFKRALDVCTPGSLLLFGSIAGDFILPKDAAAPIAFLASGIGITPFMSHLRSLQARNEKRDIILLYQNKSADDVPYREALEALQESGYVRIEYIYDRLTQDVLISRIPDFQQRAWYISGPDAAVRSYRTLLRAAGVSRRSIATDYFTGL